MQVLKKYHWISENFIEFEPHIENNFYKASEVLNLYVLHRTLTVKDVLGNFLFFPS